MRPGVRVVEGEADGVAVSVMVKGDREEQPVVGGAGGLEFLPKSGTGYVGLLNQGATCYLNSLIQALYMTPEFRRAVFEWHFDAAKEGSEEFCIPRQVQRLFARLALSRRGAVGTKELTHSFNWSSAEAFRQHDIQELMRVLFDALERTLHLDPNNTFVNTLYQGTMVDYLSCKSCKFARERQDSFLDISVVIQNVATLNEALRNFVQPEMLVGDNQWRCSGCNEKVDAEKGLKFTSLPKVLTVHLKRFVYDFNKNGRVKVNSTLRFDETLDMSQLVNPSGDDDQDDKGNNNNKDNNKPKTSLRYVLFAVLMHSGTAMGGHYFAYIRGAHDRQWYEFNDAIVSRLDREDPLKYAYGSEKSGMNAYMLMYRRATDAEYEQARQQQLDRERRLKESRSASSVAATDDSKENKSIINNTASLSSASNSSSSSGDASPSLEAKEDADADDNNSNHNDDDDDDGECKTKSKQSGRHAHMFSELIADDLRAMVDREDGEYEEKLREAERLRRLLDLCVVYNSKETRFQMDMGVTVGEASERIRQDLGLADKFAPEQLRLRFFSKQIGFAQATLEGMEKVSLQDAGFTRSNTLLLETRAPDEEFPPYNPNEIPVRVKVVSQNNIDAVVEDSAYPLHPDAFQADDVVTVHVDVVEQSVDDIARAVANAAEQLDVEAVRLVRITDDKSVQILSRDTKLSDTNIEAGIMLYCEDVRQDDAVRRYVDDKIAALLAQDDATPSSTAGGDATVSAASAALPPAIKQSPLVALFEFTQCLVKIEFNDPRPLPSSISSSSNDGDEEAKQPDAMDGAVRFSMSTRLSKNSEMRVLKEQIGAHLRLPVDEFRIKTSQVGKEFKDLSKTLGEAKLTQGSVVFVELGTPLGPNESLVKFFLYRPQRKKMQFKTLEIPVDRMMLIKDVKQLVVDKINAQFPPKKKEQQEDDSSKTDRNNDSSATDGAQQQEQEPTKNKPQRKNRFGIEHVRLRERLRQKVGKIYSDTMTLGRSIPRLKDGTQIAVQQVAVPEVVTHQHRPIFIQRWHPDTRVLDDKVEVLVRRNGPVSELKDEIVKQSSPPIERANVGVARGSTYASSNMKPEQVEKKNFKDKRVVDTGLMKMAPLRLRDGDLVLYQDNSKVPERKTGDGDAGGAGSGSGSGSGSDAASRRNRMSKYGRVSRRGRKSGVKVSMHHKSRKARPEFGLRIRTPEDVRREQEELERALAASRESAAQEQQRRDNNNNNNTNNSES
eukprot:TRINITY_DN66192_c8_g1_i3.p1 TRINITY_DN66192_c8_g1~~TRINITY_DN66192_c8_g1_i3.p1  ORF type:complete len:1232 (+),score=694.70 TRINITY_DN66192_c8_g1_i3:155-3850(+)